MDFKINENTLLILIDKTVYDENILHKCFYWYGDKYNIDIDCVDNKFQVVIENKLGNNYEINFKSLIEKIKSDLIDYKLRNIINSETRNIRDLLIAKAFSNGEFEEVPPGNISDSCGFNPNDLI